MIINKRTTQIQVAHDDKLINQSKRKSIGSILGIIGIMNVGGQNYLGVVRGAEQVGVLNNAKIFKISEAKLLPFRINPQQEEVALLDNLK